MNVNSLKVTLTSAGMTYQAYKVVDLRAAKVPEAAILSAAQAALSARVDTKAERIRSQVVGSYSGQAMEYQEALVQATAALASPNSATTALYPMLAASIGIDVDPLTGALATDVLGVARAVTAASAAWLAIGAAIRKARLAGKAAIAATTTPEAAAAAHDAITWPAA